MVLSLSWKYIEIPFLKEIQNREKFYPKKKIKTYFVNLKIKPINVLFIQWSFRGLDPIKAD